MVAESAAVGEAALEVPVTALVLGVAISWFCCLAALAELDVSRVVDNLPLVVVHHVATVVEHGHDDGSVCGYA